MYTNRPQRAAFETSPAAQSLRLAIQVKRSGRGIDGGAGFGFEGDEGRRRLPFPVCARRCARGRCGVHDSASETRQHRPGMETNP